ncbi:hypothetical protein E4U42_007422 [Claviceps africana]|uniref:Uncharacterized protein n=1 Tax=Claviceps africana TaxID=83212 RepID=A0A8K0NEK6_9HYPO|nr:hypothetical protein E4U42_007422 [Claviceps africana]
MSRVPVLQRRVDVDNSFFPHPATKLVVTQYLEGEDIARWAWIIVGTFFDSHDQPVWSTEIFIARLDLGSVSESEVSDGESDGASDTTDDSYDRARENSWSGSVTNEEGQELHDRPASTYSEQYPQSSASTIHSAPTIALYFPPPIWDPVAHGPVPGHWQARFDPGIGRWVHTWQPRL